MFDATSRYGGLQTTTMTVPDGDAGRPRGHEGRGLEVDVNGDGQLERVDVDVAAGDGEAVGYLALDADLALLRVRVAVAGLAAEDDAQGRRRAGVRDRDAELRQVGGRDAGGVAGRRVHALNPPLREQRLENQSRGERRRAAGNPRERLVHRLRSRVKDPPPSLRPREARRRGIPGGMVRRSNEAGAQDRRRSLDPNSKTVH